MCSNPKSNIGNVNATEIWDFPRWTNVQKKNKKFGILVAHSNQWPNPFSGKHKIKIYCQRNRDSFCLVHEDRCSLY